MPMLSSNCMDEAHRAKLRAMYIAGFKEQHKEQLRASQSAFKHKYQQQQQQQQRQEPPAQATYPTAASSRQIIIVRPKQGQVAGCGNKRAYPASCPVPETTATAPQPQHYVEPIVSQVALHTQEITITKEPSPPQLVVSVSETLTIEHAQAQGATGVDRVTGGVSFPRKLMEMLAKEDSSIVTWLPSGLSFRVLNNKEFAKTVLIKYFRHGRITSFQRQLNLYGFRRVQKGIEGGAYLHEMFRRDQPHLCLQMKRAIKKPSPVLNSQPSPVASVSSAEGLDPPAAGRAGVGDLYSAEYSIGPPRSNPGPVNFGSQVRAMTVVSSEFVNAQDGDGVTQGARMPKSRVSATGLGMLMSSSIGTFAGMGDDDDSGRNDNDRDCQASALAAAGMLADNYKQRSTSLKTMPPLVGSSGSLKRVGVAVNRAEAKSSQFTGRAKFSNQDVPQEPPSSRDEQGSTRPPSSEMQQLVLEPCSPMQEISNASISAVNLARMDYDDELNKRRHGSANCDVQTHHSGELNAESQWVIEKNIDFDFLSMFNSENDLHALDFGQMHEYSAPSFKPERRT
jgi:hypothetical protein